MKKSLFVVALVFWGGSVMAGEFDSAKFLRAFDLNQSGRLELNEADNALQFSSLGQQWNDCNKHVAQDKYVRCGWVYSLQNKKFPRTLVEKLRFAKWCNEEMSGVEIDESGIDFMKEKLNECQQKDQ